MLDSVFTAFDTRSLVMSDIKLELNKNDETKQLKVKE